MVPRLTITSLLPFHPSQLTLFMHLPFTSIHGTNQSPLAAPVSILACPDGSSITNHLSNCCAPLSPFSPPQPIYACSSPFPSTHSTHISPLIMPPIQLALPDGSLITTLLGTCCAPLPHSYLPSRLYLCTYHSLPHTAHTIRLPACQMAPRSHQSPL